MALDHGAVEMSFAASSARERNADTLLTPYFRILIGGPDATDVKVRMGENGDTCVDNAGANAPYVVVTSVFDGGVYRVQPGQRVMFEHGSLQSVVDQEKEPCGCPPPKTEPNEFPLAQSEGLAPTPNPPPAAARTSNRPQTVRQPQHWSTTPKTRRRKRSTIPSPPPAPIGHDAGKLRRINQAGAQKKPGFFRRVGRFFKRVFGAE